MQRKAGDYDCMKGMEELRREQDAERRPFCRIRRTGVAARPVQTPNVVNRIYFAFFDQISEFEFFGAFLIAKCSFGRNPY